MPRQLPWTYAVAAGHTGSGSAGQPASSPAFQRARTPSTHWLRSHQAPLYTPPANQLSPPPPYTPPHQIIDLTSPESAPVPQPTGPGYIQISQLSFTQHPDQPAIKAVASTWEERIAVKTLYNLAGFHIAEIARLLGLTVRQVQYAIHAPAQPAHVHSGHRPPILPPDILDIVRNALSTPHHHLRIVPWAQLSYSIPALQPYGSRALRRALNTQGARRVLRPQQLPLDEQLRQKRLEFAIQWASLLPSDWDRWIWTDETWINGLGTARRFITVFPGEDPLDLARPRTKANGWMFWACFAGEIKGPCIVWDKRWGRINSQTYQAHILPVLLQFARDHPSFLIQQDNAPSHTSRSTVSYLTAHGEWNRFVDFPARSPDLNPIEHVWIWMKRWIETNYLDRPTGRRLIAAILRAWEAVPASYLLRLARSMTARLGAVRLAEGGQIHH
jgi:transposase